jgi:hypothetical protein
VFLQVDLFHLGRIRKLGRSYSLLPTQLLREIFLYLICHDFRKLIGRIKILEKYTSGDVAHDAWSSCRRGPRRQGSAVLAGGART